MSVRSLGAAASGIDTMQTDLDTIGNDIANSETDGFASQTAQFSDLLTEQLQPAGGAVGDHLGQHEPLGHRGGRRGVGHRDELLSGRGDADRASRATWPSRGTASSS